jgi:hypothetical protein
MQTSISDGGEKIARAAHKAAEGIGKAAGYVRDQDLRAMLSDLRQVARRRPGVTLFIAAAVGFLVARALTRD